MAARFMLLAPTQYVIISMRVCARLPTAVSFMFAAAVRTLTPSQCAHAGSFLSEGVVVVRNDGWSPLYPNKCCRIGFELSTHPDSVFVDHLLSGLTQGFRVGVSCPLSSSLVLGNLQSAQQEPDVVSRLLARECDKRYVIGPFSSSPFPLFRSSPLAVAKREYSGKKRLILDLSSPRTGPVSGINGLIPLEPYSLHYATDDHAIRLIKLAGPRAWLSKADITDAFVPVHPSQWHLFGMKWENRFYFAVRLPFGCRSSPSIFNQVSEALCWILLNRVRVPALLHLLHNFLLVDPPNDASGSSLFPFPTRRHSGRPLAGFLGIMLDTVGMKAFLPAEKLKRACSLARSSVASSVVTSRQLLSLLGYLNFAMRIIPQGRSFISRLLVLASSVSGLQDPVCLDDGCRSDLSFWLWLLEVWNGVSFFYDDVVRSSDSLRFFTDATPSVGFGGYYQEQWFASPWPHNFSAPGALSAPHEIYPAVVACHLWGQSWCRMLFCATTRPWLALLTKAVQTAR